MGDEADEDEGAEAEAETSYAGELFMMAVGALFLCLNVAPTEEMILLSYKMTPWHAIAVIVASIVLMHGFVYALSFMGGHVVEEGTPGWHALVILTNSGLMHFRPEGQLDVLDESGSVVETVQFIPAPVLPARDQDFVLPLKLAKGEGKYRLRARLDLGGAEIQEATANVVAKIPKP